MLNASQRPFEMTNSRNHANLQIVVRNKLDLMLHDKPLTQQLDENGKEIPCRYVAYVRVSTDRQEHRTQMAALKSLVMNYATEYDEWGRPIKWLDWKDIHLVEEEAGTSAWKGRGKSSLQFRPEGKKLYKWIKEDSVEVVFSWLMSRLYRNSAYGGFFREQLIHEWKSRTEVICCDLQGGIREEEADLYWLIKGHMNEKYSTDISKNTSSANVALRDDGFACTETTWGWDTFRTEDFNKNTNKYRLGADPNWDEQAIRFYCIEQHDNNGWSWNKCARKMMDLGIPTKTGSKTWRSSSMKKSFTKTKQNDKLKDHPINPRMPSYPFTNYRKKQQARFGW
jgi:DNA invertase Pin-like site-specific DNA recombinase